MRLISIDSVFVTVCWHSLITEKSACALWVQTFQNTVFPNLSEQFEGNNSPPLGHRVSRSNEIVASSCQWLRRMGLVEMHYIFFYPFRGSLVVKLFNLLLSISISSGSKLKFVVLSGCYTWLCLSNYMWCTLGITTQTRSLFWTVCLLTTGFYQLVRCLQDGLSLQNIAFSIQQTCPVFISCAISAQLFVLLAIIWTTWLFPHMTSVD